MGNTSSSEKKTYKNLESVLDYIASNYILTSDFKSLTKLYEEEYCKNLVVLTQDIISKNFTEMEITYLAQRLRGKDVVNEEKTDEIIFFNKDKLDKMDPSSHLRKKRLCLGIAKFYVKIAHVFSTIVMTINPVYTYTNEAGSSVRTPFSEKDTIPKNAKNRRITREGMCFNRLNQLRHGQDFVNIPQDGNITISPKLCVDKSDLAEEPGIPELQSLYYDKFDYEKGAYNSMRDSTKTIYQKDLNNFYTVFTGNDKLPEQPLTKFSDIKLKDYNKTKRCEGHDAMFKKKVPGNLKDELFQKYAYTMQDMMRKSRNVQSELLNIINEMFTYDLEQKTGKRLVRINPELTEKKLDKIVEKTRKIVVNYYVTCEQDFEKGVKIYESIVENLMKDTTMSQIDSLEETKEQLISEPSQALPQSE
tara:strand:- start:28099 stop:29352 length:1254 start_codon:yes stop_codon:yes gene_type:complete